MMKHIDSESRTAIERKALNSRAAILSMTTLCASGHPGGSMSSIDILHTLYSMIKHDPNNYLWEERDRVIVSNGHISPAVYSVLAQEGYFPLDDAIAYFRLAGSIYEGHIERTVPGVEWTTGNLGQGLSAGAGMALAAKIKGIDYRVFVLMGDGEQQKGQISEARRFAVKHKLTNLVAIIDYNRLQISGSIDSVMPQNIRHGYEADGWKVIEINGHDIDQIHAALLTSDVKTPVMILAHTTMSKGVSFMENKEKFHGSPLSMDQLNLALDELKVSNRLAEYQKKRAAFEYDAQAHDASQFGLDCGFAQGMPILYDKDNDNRSAWGNAIADLAKINLDHKTPIVVLDCDLQGSVKTADFEAVAPQRFVQSGIMEHNTAVVAGALSASGIQTFWADFGMFGLAEVYNMQRLNDINHAHVKVVLTHVGLDVGEDGRTHQSIDYINLVRNLFGFRIICPADPNQTDRIIRWLINQPGNYVVAMGRSKLPIIKNKDSAVYYGMDYNFAYGKSDILREGNDAIVFVCGTPVSNALKAVDRLQEEGIFCRLIYVSSPLEVDASLIEGASNIKGIFTIEDHSINGGLGTTLAELLIQQRQNTKLVKIGVKAYPLSGSSSAIYKSNMLDTQSIANIIRREITAGE